MRGRENGEKVGRKGSTFVSLQIGEIWREEKRKTSSITNLPIHKFRNDNPTLLIRCRSRVLHSPFSAAVKLSSCCDSFAALQTSSPSCRVIRRCHILLRPEMSRSTKSNSTNTAAEKGEHEKWTPQMDDVLIDGLTHENNVGNRVNGTFTTTAYDNVLKEFFDRIGKVITKQQVKNRLKTIKKNFNECYDIFKGGMSGFSWDPISHMWGAEPEVWNNLFEAKPEARKWATTPIPNYEKIANLFGKDRATGLGAITAKERARQWASETENCGESGESGNIIHDIDKMVAQDHVTLESFTGMNGEESIPTTPYEGASEAPNNEAPSQTAATSSSRKRKANSGLNEEKLNSSLDRIAEALEMSNKIQQERNEMRMMSQSHIADVYSELRSLGLDEETYIKAYGFLVDNPVKVRALFACPVESRVQFLMCQMRSVGII